MSQSTSANESQTRLTTENIKEAAEFIDGDGDRWVRTRTQGWVCVSRGGLSATETQLQDDVRDASFMHGAYVTRWISAAENPHAMETRKRHSVYVVNERDSRWTIIGIGYTNADGSITLKLDALPLSGTLHVRDYADTKTAQNNSPPITPRPSREEVEHALDSYTDAVLMSPGRTRGSRDALLSLCCGKDGA